ncbi:hypothetical protein THAOC_24809, partial [Thalassiosira oceanica]
SMFENARAFNQNLCHFGDNDIQIIYRGHFGWSEFHYESGPVSSMFANSGCPGTSDPVDASGPWCTTCKQYGLIFGTDGEDIIFGGDGEDIIYGFASHDWLDGGSGYDHLLGGTGGDRLDGGNGHDTLEGGDGEDTLYGGQGEDTLDGGRGEDYLDGGWGNDILSGWDGINDTAMFMSDRSTYTFDVISSGGSNWWLRVSNEEETDHLRGIETLAFKDEWCSVTSSSDVISSNLYSNDSDVCSNEGQTLLKGNNDGRTIYVCITCA